jgi:hypothetical protein
LTAWSVALVVAAAAHLGFQLTVTLVVYPALAATPADAWADAHAAHSRRIAPLVGVLYAGVLVTAAGALLTTPTPATVVAAAAGAVAIGLTATRAGPLHVRLGRGREDGLLHSLLRVDRLRTLAALVALAAATLA